MNHLYIYVGPVIKATCTSVATPVFETQHSTGSCEFAGRTMSREQKFCHRCGEELVQVQTHLKKEPSVDVWDVSNQVDEAIFFPHSDWQDDEVHIWLPNSSSPDNMRNFTNEPYDSVDGVVLSDQIDILAEKKWIEDEFRKVLAVLQGIYEEVTIDWGIVKYWM